MQTPLELKWDELDRRISEALVVWGRDIRPPDWVWRHIVRGVVILDGMGDYARYGEDESSSLCGTRWLGHLTEGYIGHLANEKIG
jgi:hypothetical protein